MVRRIGGAGVVVERWAVKLGVELGMELGMELGVGIEGRVVGVLAIRRRRIL